MPPHRLHLPPERIAESRARYLEGHAKVADIAAELGIARRTFYTKIREWGWPQRAELKRLSPETSAPRLGRTAPLETQSHAGQPCPGLGRCPERPRLVRRLWAAAEREIAATERYLKQDTPGRPPDAAAKRLGALAATLDRLASIDRKALGGRTAPGEADDGAPLTADAIDRWAQRIAGKLAGDDDPAPLPPDAG